MGRPENHVFMSGALCQTCARQFKHQGCRAVTIGLQRRPF